MFNVNVTEICIAPPCESLNRAVDALHDHSNLGTSTVDDDACMDETVQCLTV